MTRRRRLAVWGSIVATTATILWSSCCFYGQVPVDSVRLNCGPVLCLAVSDDGRRIVVGGSDSSIFFLDVPTVAVQRQVKFSGVIPTAVEWSPDGNLVAIGFDSGQVMVWGVESEEIQWEFVLHENEVVTVDFDGSGERLLSECSGGSVYVSTVKSGVRQYFSGEISNGSGWSSVRFAGDNDMLISAGDFEPPYLSRMESPEVVQFTASGITYAACSLTSSPDRGSFVTGSWRHEIFAWDVEKRALQARAEISRWGPPPSILRYSQDGALLACVSPRGTFLIPPRISLFDAVSLAWLDTFVFRRTSAGARVECHCLDWIDSNTIITGHSDGVLRMWPVSVAVRRSAELRSSGVLRQ